MTINEAITMDVPQLAQLFADWWNSKKEKKIDLNDQDSRQTLENYIGYVRDKSLLFDEGAAEMTAEWETFLWNAYTNRQNRPPVEGEIVFGSSSFEPEDPETQEDETEEPAVAGDEPSEEESEEEQVEDEEPEEETPEESAPVMDAFDYTPMEDEETETEQPAGEPDEEPRTEEQLPEEETSETDESEQADDEPERLSGEESETEELPEEEADEPEVEELPEEEDEAEPAELPAEEPELPAEEPEAGEETPGQIEAIAEGASKEPAAEAKSEEPAQEVDRQADKPHIVRQCVQQFLFSDEEMGIVRRKAASRLSKLPVARHQVFDDALFALESGLKVNLYGPAGSGKRTLARQLKEECGSEPECSEEKKSGYANFPVGYDEKLEAQVCPKAHQTAVNLRAAGTDVTLAQCIIIEKLLPLGEQKAISAI